MGRNHMLWALAAPLSIGLFVLIPHLVTEVGAIERIIGYLAIMGGGAGALVGWAAMRDNFAPRGLTITYALAMFAWLVSFLVWLFSPLSQTRTGLAVGFYSMLVCAALYCLVGVLGLLAWLVTSRSKK